MAKIVRYNGNLVPFASSSIGTERTVFGQVTQANDITSQFTAEFLRGWGIVGASDQPTLQDFNAVSYTHGQILSYLHQVGIPEYNGSQEYHLNSMCNLSGVVYVSLANNNTGNTPDSSPSQWRVLNEPLTHGSCRVSVVSSTSLRMSRYGGAGLVINSKMEKIPSSGVTVSNSGLLANTGYYIYAFMNAGVMTLELSTTSRTMHSDGVEIKSGDPSRTLVGWTSTAGGGLFQADTSSAIVTMNWFNRRQRSTVISSATDIVFTNTSALELNSALRTYTAAWAGDSCVSNINGNFLNSLSGAGVNAQLYSNDVAQGTRMSSNLGADVYCPFNTQAVLLPVSDGIINCQLYANIGSGSGKIVTGVQLLMTAMV